GAAADADRGTLVLVGSALCGAAQNMTELVVFRGLQGLGAGGLFPLTLAVIGGIVPPRDRGRWQGLIGAVFVSASVIGAAGGGVIRAKPAWGRGLLVYLPAGAGAPLVVIARTMPKRSVRAKHVIDWRGAALLGAGTTSLLLALVWGGRDYGWASSHVLGALAAAAILLTLFGLAEMRAREPILPFELL